MRNLLVVMFCLFSANYAFSGECTVEYGKKFKIVKSPEVHHKAHRLQTACIKWGKKLLNNNFSRSIASVSTKNQARVVFYSSDESDDIFYQSVDRKVLYKFQY